MNLPSHAVRSRRFFFGPKEKVAIAFVGTLAECKKYVSDNNASVYHTSHNESGRWSLRIVRINALRPWALRDAECRLGIQSWDNCEL